MIIDLGANSRQDTSEKKRVGGLILLEISDASKELNAQAVGSTPGTG